MEEAAAAKAAEGQAAAAKAAVEAAAVRAAHEKVAAKTAEEAAAAAKAAAAKAAAKEKFEAKNDELYRLQNELLAAPRKQRKVMKKQINLLDTKSLELNGATRSRALTDTN